MQTAPSLGFGLFLTLLLAGGIAFTVRECTRLSAMAEGRSPARTLLVTGAAMQVENVSEDQRLIA